MKGILEGVRVLDFGRYIAGPFCAAMLADLGAEVIRVERPGGGEDRYLMPATAEGEGAMYLQANRGKKSLACDFSNPASASIKTRLIGGADVVIANFSPGALKHFGLDYESLKLIRDDIILTTVSAFGSEGEMKDSIGFDGVGQAVSGGIYLTGEPGRPYRSATSYVDFSTAIASAFGTLAALINRMQSGQGTHVETSLAGTALSIMNPVLIEQATGSNVREPTGNRSPIAGPSDVFAARDGWFIMQVIGQGMFKRWSALIGLTELIDDSRFTNDIMRGRNGAELSRYMNAWSASRSREECLSLLAEASVAASPVLTPAEIIGGALGLVDNFLSKVDYPGTDGVPIANPLVRFSTAGPHRMGRPPRAGEHTEEILSELGFTGGEMAEFRRIGIL
jgi:crotonobetainyl-CoA:carnitine CoA-transferase CaiB-like acyl-CoA transferase